MDYTISLNASGNEVTEWTDFSSCGNFPECHAEPPTCGCETENEISWHGSAVAL